MQASTIAQVGPVAGGEVIPPGEATAMQTIVQAIEAQVRAAAAGAPARRDAHAKMHGCVRASFRVLDDLPAALRVGIFATPGRFSAWVRFSNGAGTPQADAVGDGRGMAVKLMGVAGSASTTQDFVTVNAPAFFVRNAADYVDFQTASPQWRFFLTGWNPFRWRLHEFLAARAITRQVVRNPLAVRYFSMAPYLLDDGACKFSIRSLAPPPGPDAADGPDFLRQNLVRSLAAGDAEFEFMIQPRTRPDSMPVEDPTVVWDEAASPFVPVARIAIPRQEFDTPEQRAFGENLSFTPWHCLDAHRPLGGINRVRRVVYEAISRLRHEMNAAPRREPTDFSMSP